MADMTITSPQAIPYCDETACIAAQCVPTLCVGKGVPSNENSMRAQVMSFPEE